MQLRGKWDHLLQASSLYPLLSLTGIMIFTMSGRKDLICIVDVKWQGFMHCLVSFVTRQWLLSSRGRLTVITALRRTHGLYDHFQRADLSCASSVVLPQSKLKNWGIAVPESHSLALKARPLHSFIQRVVSLPLFSIHFLLYIISTFLDNWHIFSAICFSFPCWMDCSFHCHCLPCSFCSFLLFSWLFTCSILFWYFV